MISQTIFFLPVFKKCICVCSRTGGPTQGPWAIFGPHGTFEMACMAFQRHRHKN